MPCPVMTMILSDNIIKLEFILHLSFKLLYEESIEFCKVGLRDNIAQICVFEVSISW